MHWFEVLGNSRNRNMISWNRGKCINNSLHLACKYARIFSTDITCSEK